MKLRIFLIFFLGFFVSLNLFAENFDKWKDLQRFYKKNKITSGTLTESQLEKLPVLDYLPRDFMDIEDVPMKKELFYLIVLPIIHKTNKEILEEREMVLNIEKKYERKALNENEINEVIRLSTKYNLEWDSIDDPLFKRLKQRINIIPVSLAVGQAIIESGWGQSRFAIEGNAIFGQWTYAEDEGIVPENRDEDKSHAVLKFDNLTQSSRAYMFNINTHQAYYGFRIIRRIAETVKYTDPVSAKVKFLAAYAEIGQEYVDKLELILESNNLKEFDRFAY